MSRIKVNSDERRAVLEVHGSRYTVRWFEPPSKRTLILDDDGMEVADFVRRYPLIDMVPILALLTRCERSNREGVRVAIKAVRGAIRRARRSDENVEEVVLRELDLLRNEVDEECS